MKLSTQRCLAQGRSDVMICYTQIIGKIIVSVFLDSYFHMYRFQVPSLKLHCKALRTISVNETSVDVLKGPDQKQFGKQEKSPSHNNIIFQIVTVHLKT